MVDQRIFQSTDVYRNPFILCVGYAVLQGLPSLINFVNINSVLPLALM